MRVLFITNYYPPSNYGGGYMQLCEEVADGLCTRGHRIAVLTSTYRDGEETPRPYPVHRLLHLDPDWHSGKSAAWQFFADRSQRERRVVAHLRRLAAEFRPDVIFFWHCRGLPRMLLREAERLSSVSAAYYLADYTPEWPDEYIDFWEAQPVHWTAKLFKRPLTRLALHALAREGKPISLEYKHVVCVSDYVRRRLVSQDLISPDAVVIHNGVDLSCFSPKNHSDVMSWGTGLRCLIAGRVVADKGIHTVIEALAQLQAQKQSGGITLTILGDGPADYRHYLHRLVIDNQLQSMVEFRLPIPREQMPKILAEHNTLLLPSEYAEPLARAGQEAMAMGLLVIGTTTGGSGELLVHETTGLVFEHGDSESLATQLTRVLNEPELAARLAQTGRQTVVAHFDIQLTIRQVERYLLDLENSQGDWQL